MKSMKGMGALGPIWPPEYPGPGGQGPTCPPGFGAPGLRLIGTQVNRYNNRLIGTTPQEPNLFHRS